MGSFATDSGQGVEALRRLLREALGEQARVDALLALSQRQVWVATWPAQQEARTVSNRLRETGMPIFTGTDTLLAAAGRLGWCGAQGTVPVRQLGVREALRHALARGVHFVVVDLGAPHMMEFSRGEIEPLLTLSAQQVGPYALNQGGQDSLWRAVRRSSQPPVAGRGSFMPAPPVTTEVAYTSLSSPTMDHKSDSFPILRPLPYTSTEFHDEPRTPITAPDDADPLDDTVEFDIVGAAQTAEDLDRLTPMSVPIPHILAAAKHSDTIILDDKVLDVLAHALRAFPEVEWACALVDEHEGSAVGLHLDPAFHHRLGEIWQALGREVADREGELSVILLSTPQDVRRARENGTVFFPGRRRSV